MGGRGFGGAIPPPFLSPHLSGASSMTSLGLATRIAIPCALSRPSTVSQSSVRRDALRDRARPAPWHVEPKVSAIPVAVPVST